MKYVKSIVLTLALLSLSAFAHDGSHGMKGTVTAMTDKTITLETPDKKTVTINYDAKTTFTKSGTAATAKDLKVGERVVIESHDMDGKMHAVNVRFGKPAPKSGHSGDHATHTEKEKK